ncbi:hypothetical protein ES703_77513 [subsurface metagenome]
MRILLLAMPDTSYWLDYYIRMPNLALISLAGNLPEHDVKILDLALIKPKIKDILKKTLEDFKPQIVGMSAMSFQFATLLRVARFIRTWDSSIKLVAGGYHPSLMASEIVINGSMLPLDFIVRCEGEITFRELVNEIAKESTRFDLIKGLTYFQDEKWFHNPDRPISNLEDILPPKRDSRIRHDFYFLDMPGDVAETSRGCPLNCKFCSITQMYGRSFRQFLIDRVISDLKSMRDRGTKAVFFVDDNITYDTEHFREICQAIIDNELTNLYYIIQTSAIGIAKHPDIVELMDRANFRLAAVGLESMDPSALKEMRKGTNPEMNQRAVSLLKKHKIGVNVLFIVGYPDDTKESIIRSYRKMRKLKPDGIYVQYLTPYPKTEIRQEMLDANLVENKDDFSKYDGFSCNVRTKHLTQKELFGILQKECIKAYFDLRLIFSNYLLRRHFKAFVSCTFKTFGVNLYNIIKGKQKAQQLDI